jgi:hypothetical protein
MYNYNYEDENINYNREPINQRSNYYDQNVNEIYKKDRRYYPMTNYKNIESNISSLNRPPDLMSSMQFESNPLTRSSKSQRFQNENPTIYRVSPYHYQYISRLQDDDNNCNDNNNIYLRDYNYQEDKNNGDQSYNIERERRFKNYNQYINSKSINRHLNYLERNDDYKKDNIKINNNINNNNYNNINTYNNLNKKIDNINDYNLRKNNYMNIKYKTPNEYSYREKRNNRYSNFNNELLLEQKEQIRNNNDDISNYRTLRNSYNINNNQRRDEKRRYIMRRNNSDLNFVYNNYNKDRFIENERYRNQSQIKYEPNEYYDNIGIKSYNEKRNYYNPERNDYKGSRYGDYTYNYYLNGPMRGDISKDWRFPPIYYYRPNSNIRNNLYYSSVNDENYIKDKFFNENI